MTNPSSNLASATLDLQKQLRGMVPPELLARFVDESDGLGKIDFAANALKVGERAPDFVLPDVSGKPLTLAGVLKERHAVVAFYRGAWCPYCNLQLRSYRAVLPDITAFGATLVAISPQTPDASLSMAQKHDLAFPVLSDAGNHVARAYGLTFRVSDDMLPIYRTAGSDLVRYNGDQSWELPVPGVFIVGRDGIVRLSFVDGDYSRRLEPEAILDVLRTL